MPWVIPKTDWVNGNVPSPDDFNRIEGNTLENHNHAIDTDNPHGVTTAQIGAAVYKNGSGTFTAGTTSYQVDDAFISGNTAVTISPTSEKQGIWTVDSYAGYFKITSDTNEASAVIFDWWAVKAG